VLTTTETPTEIPLASKTVGDTDSTGDTADNSGNNGESEASVDSLSSTLTTTGYDDDPDGDADSDADLYDADAPSNSPKTTAEALESEPNSDSDDPWAGIDVDSIAPGSMDADSAADTPRRWSILTWADPDQRKLHPSGTDDTGILIDREWLRDRTVLAAKRIDRKLP